MEPIEGWKDFRETRPMVDSMKKPQSGHKCSYLGFHIDDYGLPIPFASMPAEEQLAKWRADQGSPLFEPVVAGDLEVGHFRVSELDLSVHGVPVVDGTDGDVRSHGLLRHSREFIYGSAYKGSGCSWRGEAWSLGDMGGTARLFKWQLADVASITVSRAQRMFKLRDEEITLRGEVPDASAKGLGAGVSVSDWLGGSQPEDVTQVQASLLRIRSLDVSQIDIPASDGSPMLGFAEHLGRYIAEAKGASATWNLKAFGKDRQHVLTFS